MDKQLNAEEYYKIASFFEGKLETITKQYENLLIPVISTPQHFSQPTPEARVLGRQLSLLKRQTREAILILNTLALIAKNKDKEKFQVDALLQSHMRQQVEFYIKYYENPNNEEKISGENRKTKNDKARN